ncbi:MAG: hypothetical protein SFV15_05280 [Polyangiaceae bacterium]|nr:hypothetical protein [Polyangiaceae bacterium]
MTVAGFSEAAVMDVLGAASEFDTFLGGGVACGCIEGKAAFGAASSGLVATGAGASWGAAAAIKRSSIGTCAERFSAAAECVSIRTLRATSPLVPSVRRENQMRSATELSAASPATNRNTIFLFRARRASIAGVRLTAGDSGSGQSSPLELAFAGPSG